MKIISQNYYIPSVVCSNRLAAHTDGGHRIKSLQRRVSRVYYTPTAFSQKHGGLSATEYIKRK